MEILNTTARLKVIPSSGIAETLARLPEKMTIKVAAYCRVSTDNREQESSYEAQVNYFDQYICNHKNWQLVKIYADPGISGKSIRRPEFQRMMNDAREGKIDRILAKSVSRFARNTLDCVSCCRELKELGIGVFFEKENIDTMDPTSSFTLTLMASLAEEESRSISSNTKWGMRKRFANGSFRMNCEQLYGYYYDKKGNIQINEDEASIVRRIYSDFASGLTPNAIARCLNDEGIHTKFKGDTWFPGTIRSILSNEKYMGDMRLQKTFRPDFLSKQRRNNGEIESYYIENHHESIIDPKYFKMIQYLIKRNDQLKKTPHYGVRVPQNRHALSGRIYCGECGSVYVRKNEDHKQGPVKAWVCSKHLLNKNCPAIPIKEQVFLDAFKKAFTWIFENKFHHILSCKKYYDHIRKLTFDKEEEYQKKLDFLNERISKICNDTKDFESCLFKSSLDEIRKEIMLTKEERDRIIPSYYVRKMKAQNALKMMRFLEETTLINDETIFDSVKALVDRIVVLDNDLPTESINIVFYNGETFNIKLVNKKKRKCKQRVCYRDPVNK